MNFGISLHSCQSNGELGCKFHAKLGCEVVMLVASEVEFGAFFCNVKRFICNNYITKPMTSRAMNFATSPV